MGNETAGLLAKPISRRLFLSASVVAGSLVFKGSALGGRLQAWADESGQEHFVVYLLGKDEVPIMVYDVSGSSPVALAGCSVTIESWCTNTSKTVVTDEAGFAPMSVRDLSFQKDDDTASVYNFWGAISAEKDGYRQFYEGNHWIEAGTPTAEDGSRPNTIEIPTQPDDGTPYLRSFMLDESDIQYASGVCAYVRSSNDADHVVALQVAAGEAGAQVEASLLINGVQKATATATAAAEAPHLADIAFTDKWLSLASPGDELSVRFGVQGKTTYAFSSPVAFEESLLLTEEGQMEDQMISPGLQANADPEDYAQPLPTWMGCEGDSLYFTFPFMPVQLFCDDSGCFGIVATLLRVDVLKTRDGTNLLEGKKRVNWFGGLSGKNAMDLFASEAQRYANNLRAAYGQGADMPEDASVKAFGTTRYTYDFNLRFVLSGMGYGQVEKDEDSGDLCTSLDLALSAEFGLAFSCVKNVVICYVPTCWGFDFSAYTKPKIMSGMKFKNCFEDIEWSHNLFGDIGLGAIVVAVHVEVGLSAGLGIAGVCSISIRGYGYLNTDFVFDGEEGKPYPQITCTLGCGVQLIAQFLFFKATDTVASLDLVKLSNVEDGKQAGSVLGSGFDPSAQSLSLSEISADKMQLVTDLGLKERFESTGRWAAAGEGGLRSPRFEAVKGCSAKLRAGVLNPFRAKSAWGGQAGQTGLMDAYYNPINGLKPTVEERLWEGCYSNPRMRIVHTSKDSFSNDRCFMIRLAVVNVEIPDSVEAFASGAFFESEAVEDEAFEGEGGQRTMRASIHAVQGAGKPVVVLDGKGNYRVVFADSSDSVRTSSDAEAATSVPRTRLIVSEWDADAMTWGDAEVVDFMAEGEVYESDRLNAHDVDFDVEVLEDGTLLLAITSLTRPDDSSEHQPIDYEKNQYISLVRWDQDEARAIAAGSTRSINVTGRSLFHPRIMRQFFDDGSGDAGQRCLVYSYVCEYDQYGLLDCDFAVTAFDSMEEGEGNGPSGQHRLTPPVNIFPSGINMNPSVLSTGTFEVACPDRSFCVADEEFGRSKSAVVISWSRPKSDTGVKMEALSLVLSETFGVALSESGSTTQYHSSVDLKASLTLSKVPNIVKLTSHDQKGLFSYSDASAVGETKPLRMITYNKDDCTLETIQDTGESTLTQYFSSFNGRRLYTVRVMEGENPGLSDEAAAAVANGAAVEGVSGPFCSPQASEASQGAKKVALYQLLEARWVDELQTYYDFYPIAQLEHVPDNIGVIAVNDVRTDFTFATITDIDSNKADLYQVAVPKIMAANCSNATPVSPFAAPGDTCWYFIDIANVGNAPITLIAMSVYDADGNEISITRYDDLSLCVQSGTDSIRSTYDEDGHLAVDENGCGKFERSEDARDTAGILWPGKSRTYKFGFTVPSDGSSGDVEFSVGISAVEDHVDDEVSSSGRFQAFCELTASEGASGGEVAVIAPFADGMRGGALGGTLDDGDGTGSSGDEIVYGGGTLFDAVRHKFAVYVNDSRIGVAASGNLGAARYLVVGPDGELIDPDDSTGGSGDDGSGSGDGGSGSSGGAGSGGSGSAGAANAGGTGGASSASDAGAPGENLASTGDGAAPVLQTGLAGALLGAAAMGVAAYEKRRAENEGSR